MQNKFKLNTTLSFFIVIIFLAGIFWVFDKKNDEISTSAIETPENQVSENNSEVNEVAELKWLAKKDLPAKYQQILPQIESVLESSLSYPGDFGFNKEYLLFSEIDVNGDGEEDLLVDLGVGGAYTTSINIILIKEGKPELAMVRDKDGQEYTFGFLSGASVRNSLGYKIHSDLGAITTIYISSNVEEGSNEL